MVRLTGYLLSFFLIYNFSTKAEIQTQCHEVLVKNFSADMKWGYLNVPENWDKPNSKKISIFYYGYIPETIKPEQHPIVFINGGPTQNSHSYDQLFKEAGFNTSDPRFPFIYFDQRGTGCSSPYPAVTSENVNILALYGSRAIVKDAEFLRKKLFGSKKWRLFGQSYGGLVAHRYIEIAPEGVEAAFVHGDAVYSDSIDWVEKRMLSQWRIFQSYSKEYPQDAVKIAQMRSLIKSSDCFKKETTEICGPGIIDGLVLHLSFKEDWIKLHEQIESRLFKNDILDRDQLEIFAKEFILLFLGQNSEAQEAITQLETVPHIENSRLCGEVTKRLIKKNLDPEKWPLYECRLIQSIKSPWSQLNAHFNKRDPLNIQLIKNQLEKNPDIRLFLYSGELDSFVPKETFEEEVAVLGKLVQYTHFSESGHEGFATEKQIWSDLKISF